MEIKSISYPTALSKIDDNVDVFVELDDGITKEENRKIFAVCDLLKE